MTKYILLISSVFFLSCKSKKVETVQLAALAPQEEVNLKNSIKETQLAQKKDPVCGMPAYKYLKDTALYNGKIYGFCGSGCKTKFKESPANYVLPKEKNK